MVGEEWESRSKYSLPTTLLPHYALISLWSFHYGYHPRPHPNPSCNPVPPLLLVSSCFDPLSAACFCLLVLTSGGHFTIDIIPDPIPTPVTTPYRPLLLVSSCFDPLSAACFCLLVLTSGGHFTIDIIPDPIPTPVTTPYRPLLLVSSCFDPLSAACFCLLVLTSGGHFTNSYLVEDATCCAFLLQSAVVVWCLDSLRRQHKVRGHSCSITHRWRREHNYVTIKS